jgi:transposase
MIGRLKPQKELFSYAINLDKRVRSEHPLRRIRELVDFSFVRDEVKDLYGYNGNESVPPEVILKLLFLLFYEDVASERELMRVLPERLDYLWFLGYEIDDAIPNHSVLSKARARWGRDVFESFFVRVVRQCWGAGLIDGRKIHLDGSLVDANASTDSVLEGGQELIGVLKRLYRAQDAKLNKQGHTGYPHYQRSNKRLLSKTDPDAPVVRQGKGGPRPRYKNHRAVDNAHGVITALETTPGDVEENSKLLDLVDQHQANTGVRADTVVADRQYGTVENFRKCRQRGLRSHMADLQSAHRKKPRCQGIFPESSFVYDPDTDTYRCPAGQILRRGKQHKTRQAWEYRAKQAVCRSCAIRDQCTRSKTLRAIRRNENQEAIDEARTQAHSREARLDRRRRRFLMEGSFADAANNHHFKRARWRRLRNQQVQDYLIAAIQNVRILLRRGQLKPAVSLSATLDRAFSSILDLSAALWRAFRPANLCWPRLAESN